MVMTRRKLYRLVDRQRIEEAIKKAERRTSGEIRVCVATFFWGSVEKEAARAFERLGMTRTKERNGVLFLVVPSRRKFVVRGDQGIHDRVGQEFWEHVVEAVSQKFHEGDFTEGLVNGIEEVGEKLATHFPYDPATDKDELSDDVEYH
jgi:uncharacterized membrane protein